jgi:S1-C subfamily serine protease
MIYLELILIIAVALLPFSSGVCSSDVRQSNPSDVVVKIQTVRNPPNYHQPWQNIGNHSINGSGLIVAGNRILTNAHVVSDSVFIHVRRGGRTEKYAAEVEFFNHESDLALLKVDDAEFFKDVATLPVGILPDVRDKVAVYGFPDGGDKLSITEGVVSRIEHINYAYSGAYLLACQIDASINSGNSGGPVVFNNQVVGIAFQGMNYIYENIGYMIPAPVILQFLDDVKDGSIDGIPDPGLTMQKLESPYLRRFYQLTPKENGVLINKVLPGSPAGGLLRSEDVILAIEGEDVAYDGTISLRKNQRTYFGYLLQNKQLGENVLLTIKRDGKTSDVKIELTKSSGFARLVPGLHESKPRYYILGGLVFQPLTLNYLQGFVGSGGWAQSAPVELMNYYLNKQLDIEGREIVLLSEVLADKANIGYHELGNNVVRSVNGQPVNNFKHFVRLIEENDSQYLLITVSPGTKILLDRKEILQSTARIIGKYSITTDRLL